MYIDHNNRKRTRSDSKWLIFTIYIIILFTLEAICKKPLFKASDQFIIYLQGSDPKNNYYIKVAQFFTFLGSNSIFIPLLIMVYNYVNIYKTYTLLMSLLISIGSFSILKVVYSSPRPYFKNEKIETFGCEGGWGNPSGNCLSSMAFYLTLWHIITDCKELRNQKLIKNIYLLVTCLLIVLIMFSRIMVGAHSINQVLFGGLLGFGIYYFLFFVLCIRPNDHEQFSRILNFKNITYFTGNSLIFLFIFLIFLFNEIDEDTKDKYYINIINKCPNTTKNLLFNREALLNFGIFLSNIGAFIGVKFEYFFLFRENLENWYQSNFEMNEPNDDSSLLTKITLNRETQWNHTNSFYSVLRLFLIIVFSAIMIFPFFFVNWSDDFGIVFIFKILVPANTLSFAFFYLFKILMKSLRMINLSVYSLNDSL
jgi:membrane-associated phospholipid phosphatase